jgi:hypothetical protein
MMAGMKRVCLHSEGFRMVVNGTECILVCFRDPMEGCILSSGMKVTYTFLRIFWLLLFARHFEMRILISRLHITSNSGQSTHEIEVLVQRINDSTIYSGLLPVALLI